MFKQLRTSTAVRSDRERSTASSNIAFTLQRPTIMQGGKIRAQNPSTTHDVFNPKDLTTVDASAQGVFRTSSPKLENQIVFSLSHFF